MMTDCPYNVNEFGTATSMDGSTPWYISGSRTLLTKRPSTPVHLFATLGDEDLRHCVSVEGQCV